jgi:dTDP-4-dehydrorhamnose reductase
MSVRLFVTGGTGYLGQELVRRALALGWEVAASHHTRPPLPCPATWVGLDLRDPSTTRRVLEALHPDVVIHTAYAQSGPDLWPLSAEAPGHLATIARRLGARLIQLSTDLVFDGQADRPYREDDPPNPLSEYGRAKLEAERRVLEHEGSLVVRTSLIYGSRLEPPDKHSLFALRLLRGEAQGVLFEDEFRTPVAVEDMAAALLELAQHPRSGILHVAGPEVLSRLEFGRLLVRARGLDPSPLPSGSTASFPGPRARNTALDCTLAHSLLRTRLRGVREALGQG